MNEEDPEDITHAQALREIFEGVYTKPVYYSRYGWALETLCDYLGPFPNNSEFCPVRPGWEDVLDKELEKHRTRLRFLDLINRPPIPLPPWNDWPCVGHWRRTEIRRSARSLPRAVSSTRDAWVRDALSTVQQWFRQALRWKDGIIVGFYG